MKIGILSMQRIFNYGSFLQAYGLKHMLESMGHEVLFLEIEYKSKSIDHEKSNKYFKENVELLFNKFDVYLWKRIKYKLLNKKLDDMFVKQQNKHFGSSNETNYEEKYDAIIIGSDEVFNCMQKWEISYKLFGQDLPAPIIITYAASCGYTNLKDIDVNTRTNIQKALSNISMFSVRDRNTYNFLYELTGRKPSYHLDPVLIYDFENEVKQAIQEVKIKDKFILVYAYLNRMNNKEEIQSIREYAKDNGLRTIAVGGSQPWCDEFIILTPFQVLVYFIMASCIVTDTFHGSVVSAKYNKPFATIIRESNRNKLGDLLQRLHLEKHMLKDMKDIGNVLSVDDFEYFNKIINSEKAHSIDYLIQINKEELTSNE